MTNFVAIIAPTEMNWHINPANVVPRGKNSEFLNKYLELQFTRIIDKNWILIDLRWIKGLINPSSPQAKVNTTIAM